MEGLGGILDEVDEQLATHLVAEYGLSRGGVIVSAPKSKVPTEVEVTSLEGGFISCGVNFLTFADVLSAIRRRWRRLASKLWLMKSVGLGIIPALTHVGGRDLGDYVSSPDDYVGLVAEHFASAWTLRDAVSALDSTFQVDMDTVDHASIMERLKSAKIQWSRAKYDTLRIATSDRDLSSEELMVTISSCLSSMLRIADSHPS